MTSMFQPTFENIIWSFSPKMGFLDIRTSGTKINFEKTQEIFFGVSKKVKDLLEKSRAFEISKWVWIFVIIVEKQKLEGMITRMFSKLSRILYEVSCAKVIFSMYTHHAKINRLWKKLHTVLHFFNEKGKVLPMKWRNFQFLDFFFEIIFFRLIFCCREMISILQLEKHNASVERFQNFQLWQALAKINFVIVSHKPKLHALNFMS